MLPKKNRADKKAIERIFKFGRFISSPNLTLKFISTKEPVLPRVSVVAPKTVSKKAVDRNLLRRRGYAVLSKHIEQFPPGFLGAFVYGKKSMDIFSSKKTENYNPIQNLENEIKIILSKLH